MRFMPSAVSFSLAAPHTPLASAAPIPTAPSSRGAKGLIPGFTQKYRIHRLVYFEHFANARSAIAREKQIKAWRREKKVALIEMRNSTWSDLAESLFRRRPKQQIPRPGRTGLGMTN
jgi:hypothetical protein